MSVLNFPRIYFKGEIGWNPPTGNNNDVFPFYNARDVTLNWEFLASQGITPTTPNLKATLQNWIITELDAGDMPDYVLNIPGNSGTGKFPKMSPAEWDLFGDNACYMVDYLTTKSTVIGGELEFNNYNDTDPLVGANFQILGNPFGGTDPTPGRFVDISPWENTFTALYFDKLIFGDAQTGIELKREYRMLDRFLNFNWGALGGLSYVTTTWQSCFPTDSIVWNNAANSALLNGLQEKLSQPNVKGLMVRFGTYLTVYDKNGIFNDYPPVETHGSYDPEELKAMYQKGLENSSEIFFNPAHSILSGSLGLWHEGDFPTCPGGRRLVADQPVNITHRGDQTSIGLGVLSAEVNTGSTPGSSVLSLDTLNTFPFEFNNADIPVPSKFNAGDFTLMAGSSNIAQLTPTDYSQTEFDKRSGIIDIGITAQQASDFANNELTLTNTPAGQTTPLVNAASEQEITAEIIESGTFMDVGETVTLNIMLQQKGQPLTQTKLWVAQYSNPYSVGTSGYYLAFEAATPAVDFQLTEPGSNESVLSYYPQFQETAALTSNAAEYAESAEANNTEQLFVSRIAPNNVNVNKPVAQAVKTALSATAGYQAQNYSEILATPVGMSLETLVDFTGSETVTRTLVSNSSGDTVDVSYKVVEITTDSKGVAQLEVTGVSPGFPTLLFNLTGKDDFRFSFDFTEAYVDFLAPVRVLPHDDTLMNRFVDKWNAIYTQQDASQVIWEEFIYPEILEVFYYLYPIMDKYMPLDNLERIEGAVDQLIRLISAEYREESTLAMPITRDLPSSSRQVLETWANLIKRGYPPEPLPTS